jgi:hypothetical protein
MTTTPRYQITAVSSTKLTVRRSSTPLGFAPTLPRSNEADCCLASNPSKFMLISSSITKVIRLAVRGNGTTRPPANPRGVPNGRSCCPLPDGCIPPAQMQVDALGVQGPAAHEHAADHGDGRQRRRQ